MKETQAPVGLKARLTLAADRFGRVNEWFFCVVVFALISLLMIPTISRAAGRGDQGGAGGQGGAAPAFASKTVPRSEPAVSATIAAGDTLIGVLLDAGVSTADARTAIDALGALFQPRELRAGQRIELRFHADSASAVSGLESLRLDVDPTKSIVATRAANGEFRGETVSHALSYKPLLVKGRVSTTLYEAAQEAGLPLPILMEMIRAYSFDVDFQREVHPGDAFTVLFRRGYDSQGRPAGDDSLVFAALDLGGTALPIYRYTTTAGSTDFFNAQGRSVRKMLMKTPVEGAWISSVFGWRRHPIYGYTEFHRGLDFAVPMNTPIMAAGNGVVEAAGYDREYGNYVQLRHSNGYSTLYAHMNSFARGISSGARVEQGQIIGYSGTTGDSTGPHVHYEVRYRGEPINPSTVASPAGPVLSGEELARFTATRSDVDAQLLALESGKGKQRVRQSGALPAVGGRSGS